MSKIPSIWRRSSASFLNFIRSPADPFVADASLVRLQLRPVHQQWRRGRMDSVRRGDGTDYHSIATMVDPTTGLPRLIFGNDPGIWSVLDNNGTFETQIGNSDACRAFSRNGNLQITQFYYGAAQPSNAAAQIAAALFYGSAQDSGGPISDPNIISNGDLVWSSCPARRYGVATDQQGNGTLYEYFCACCRWRLYRLLPGQRHRPD